MPLTSYVFVLVEGGGVFKSGDLSDTESQQTLHHVAVVLFGLWCKNKKVWPHVHGDFLLKQQVLPGFPSSLHQKTGGASFSSVQLQLGTMHPPHTHKHSIPVIVRVQSGSAV